MSKGIKALHIFIILAFALVPAFSVSAQVDDLVQAGDSLYRLYRFEEAQATYNNALIKATSKNSTTPKSVLSSISERVQIAQNASQMAKSVRTPNVLGRKKVSVDECCLYLSLDLSLEDKGWRRLPNQLDPDADDEYVNALYVPDLSKRIYFSADDGTGTRSIYVTDYKDGVWSAKREVKEVSSAGVNEIYPMVSSDQKTLYFASDAPGGLGGYDIYYSKWDDLQECWTMPKNMGIPFSSPDDDFLYVDSADEMYSMFVSTRDCAKDSVWVYALEYDREPVDTSFANPEQLYAMSRLVFNRKTTAVEEPRNKQSDDVMQRYQAQVEVVRILSDSLSLMNTELETLMQKACEDGEASEREILMELIKQKEGEIAVKEKEQEAALILLEKIQDEFLNPADEDETDSDDLGSDDYINDFLQYDFVKRSFGGPLELNIAAQDEQFDYSFRILNEAVFAEDQTLPDGIVYQIELFGNGRKAMLSELKGLSPVYESLSPIGMYVYRVGCFATFDEAEDNVKIVRELGFQRPHVCAFENGVEIPVKKARTTQERLKGGFGLYEVFITPDSGELESDVVEAITSTALGKDIVLTEKADGTQVYIVGPLGSKSEAEELVKAIKKILTGKVVIEPIKN